MPKDDVDTHPAINNSNGTDVTRINNAEDSTEADPFTDKKATRKSNRAREFLIGLRDNISKKTELTSKALYYFLGVAVLCFVLLIVVIALAAAWPRVPHKYKFPICQEAACLRAAAQVRESLNDNVSPCDNLWGWACGGWLQNHPLPKDKSLWNLKQKLVKEENERIRDLIATLPLPLKTGTFEWKLKRLYDACLDVDNARASSYGAQSLASIISQLGGWCILKDWTGPDFDPDATMKTLHSQYGATPFFKASVEPHPNTPGYYVIKISPSGLGLPKKEYYFSDNDERIQEAYKDFIKDTVMYLGTTRADAQKFARDIFSYEKRLAEIFPDLNTLNNPVTTYNPIFLSELKDNMIKFYDILSAMYPESNITDKTEVIVTSPDYLSSVSQIIATTDRTTKNGYLIWTFVRKYVPYLSNDYVLAEQNYQSELLGLQAPKERWETCSELVKYYMGLGINALIQKQEPIDEFSPVVVNTFDSILNVVKTRIEKFEKVSSNLHRQLKTKLNSLILQIGLPKFVFSNSTYLNNYYLKLMIIKSELFTSVKNAITFKQRVEENLLKQTPQHQQLFYHDLDEPKVYYSPSDNAIIIPRVLLTKSFVESNYPLPILYGRLGVEIAHAIISSVLPYGSLWTSDRKILTPYHMTVNESLTSVDSGTRCLRDFILDLHVDIPNSSADEIALNTLKDISAVGVANEALQNYLKKLDHTHQPALENFEDTELFFLSYAQTQCSESTSQYQLYEKRMHFNLPQPSVLHLVWSQLPQFSQALDCRLNKKTQCKGIF